MIFNYECPDGHVTQINIKFGEIPPASIPCGMCSCSLEASRVWEAPQVICDTDPDYVPPEFAVSRGGHAVSASAAAKKEKMYQRGIEQRRAELRGTRNKKGFKQSNSIPPELYYGKVRQSGDKDYWKDPKNLRKHSSTKVT